VPGKLRQKIRSSLPQAGAQAKPERVTQLAGQITASHPFAKAAKGPPGLESY